MKLPLSITNPTLPCAWILPYRTSWTDYLEQILHFLGQNSVTYLNLTGPDREHRAKAFRKEDGVFPTERDFNGPFHLCLVGCAPADPHDAEFSNALVFDSGPVCETPNDLYLHSPVGKVFQFLTRLGKFTVRHALLLGWSTTTEPLFTDFSEWGDEALFIPRDGQNLSVGEWMSPDNSVDFACAMSFIKRRACSDQCVQVPSEPLLNWNLSYQTFRLSSLFGPLKEHTSVMVARIEASRKVYAYVDEKNIQLLATVELHRNTTFDWWELIELAALEVGCAVLVRCTDSPDMRTKAFLVNTNYPSIQLTKEILSDLHVPQSEWEFILETTAPSDTKTHEQ